MPTLILSDAEFEAMKEIRPTLLDAFDTLKMVEKKRLDTVTRAHVTRSKARLLLLLDARRELDNGND